MIKYNNVSLCCSTNGLILDELSFEIQEGEFFVLVGPSGSGKTTTIKLINRLIEQTDGDIYFEDKRLKDYDLRELRLKTGYVLQQIALFPNLTVAENIALIPEMKNFDKKEIKEKTEDLLTKVGLDPKHYMNRLPKELSGGEKQRVAVARALMNNPAVILADEPSGSLDSKNKEELHKLFFELRNKFGQTFVIVTHDETLATLTDRTIHLKDGRIVGEGSEASAV